MTAEKLVPPGQVIVVTSEEHYSVDRRGARGVSECRNADVRVTARDVGEVLGEEVWGGLVWEGDVFGSFS